MDWSRLDGMSPEDQIDHLKFMVEELVGDHLPGPSQLDCLTLQQRRIVGRLVKSEGRTVPHSSIHAACWADRSTDEWPVDAGCHVSVQLRGARRRLARAGVPLRIEAIFGIGYRAKWTPETMAKRVQVVSFDLS